MTAPSTSRTRRALLVGIDAYQRIRPLDGCVNDVTLMKGLLEDKFGFAPENMTMLTNDEATREAIVRELDALVDRTGTDDIVVMHFAGHGSMMTDREGDEPSGLDSTIMPVDSEGWSGDNRDITDDEIHLRLVELGEKTRYTTLIFDCCHSGTITRDTFGASSRSWPPDTRPVSELPPSPIPKELWGATRGEGSNRMASLGGSYVMMAGCRDEEKSFEYKPPEANGTVAHGAMTYFLCAELRNATSGTSYRDVFERVAARVSAIYKDQHPQMEGEIDRELFGIADLKPMRFVKVSGRDGDRVTLAAGAALGMAVGSKWAIHPQGTKDIDTSAPLGEVQITAVRAVSTDATIVSEKEAGAIVAGARAVETEHEWGEMRMLVEMASGDDPAILRLRGEIASSSTLRVTAPAERGAARVYLLQPRTSAAPEDPAPQIGAVAKPTWVVVGEDGQLLMPPLGVMDVTRVRELLERRAKYRQALALENPDPMSELRAKVELELLRRDASGAFVIAAIDPKYGEVVYEEGELAGLRIRNRSERDLYVSVLDFGLSGGIFPLYPPPAATDFLPAGRSFDVTTTPTGGPLDVSLPDGFPFDDGRTEGVETVKLVATTGPADFWFLAQEGVGTRSGAPGAGSPITKLFKTATGFATTRELGAAKPVLAREDWTTVVRQFVVRRTKA
jgi:hypothetical protein